MVTATFSAADRAAAARRGRNLEIFTVVWAGLETAIGLIAAWRAGSLSLAGFGFDSLIEMISGAALLWRMSHELNCERRHHAEKVSLRIAGICLLALGGYILIDAVLGLRTGRETGASWVGIGITASALISMPLLARAKRKVGRALNSGAMMTDAKQADFCMYQAAIVLLGLLAHAIFGISWADSAAALLLVPFLLRAGILSLQGKAACC